MSKNLIKWSVISAGVTAMASQIIFLREFLVVFGGNELSIGIVLANWLMWGGIGSVIAGILAGKVKSGRSLLAFNQLLLAIALPFFFFLVRVCRPFLGTVTGEITGYSQIYLYSLIALSVPCILTGSMFSCGCRVYKDLSRTTIRSVSNVYILEAIGSLLGGVLAGMFLFVHTPQSFILIALSLLNAYTSFLILSDISRSNKVKILSVLFCIFCSGIFVYITGSGTLSKIDKISVTKEWKDFNVITSGDSAYGNVTLTGAGDEFSFYENGLYLYSVPDPLYAEELTHFNMLQNSARGKVLVIGGGVEILNELLKYDVSRIDYVELDPLIVSIGKKYMKDIYSRALSDKRVNVIFEDGRAFVMDSGGKYDNILISAGDPYTAFTNRYYTLEFFNALKKRLNPGGVVSFGLTSSNNYLSDEAADYLGSIYNTVKKLFPEVLLIPGDTMYFIFSSEKERLIRTQSEIEKRRRELDIPALYVRDYYLEDKLSVRRLEYARDIIGSSDKDLINTDLHPVTYYFSSRFWNSQLDDTLWTRIFDSISARTVLIVFFSISVIFALFKPLLRTGFPAYPYYLSVFSTGFSEMVFQMVTIISFQVLYGFVYFKMGLIFASFMIGLGIGGWIYNKYMIRITDHISFYRRIQMLITIYPVILLLIMIVLDKNRSLFLRWAGSEVILPLLPVVPGILGGIQFPAANRVSGKDNADYIKHASSLYAVDLIGAAVGAVIASAILIPVLGLTETCLLCAAINIFTLLILPKKKNFT